MKTPLDSVGSLARCLVFPLAVGLAAAAPLSAQTALSFAPHIGVDAAVPGTPVTGGLNATWYGPAPWLGVRGRVDIGIITTDLEDEAGEPLDYRTVAGEADLLLGPRSRSPETALIGALDPVLFAGLGVRSARDSNYDAVLSPTLSYGAGVRYLMSERFRLEVEARYRQALTDDELAADFDDGLSVSLGAALHVGLERDEDRRGGPGAPRALPRPRSRSLGERPALRYQPRPDIEVRARETWPAPEEETVAEVLAAGQVFLGTPYVWGGATPEPGFDCSGFVQFLYDELGIPLPRPSRRMALVGAQLPTVVDSLRPGDLMFFAKPGERVSHVAIYAGDNEILHSSGSGYGVSYDDLGTRRGRWFTRHLVAASRVIGVPVQALRSAPISITPETWDPIDDAPPAPLPPPERRPENPGPRPPGSSADPGAR
jgi:hypothetical protein